MAKTASSEFGMKFLKRPELALDEKNAAILLGIFKPRQIRKEDYFLRSGEPSTEVGFILNGVFRSFYIDQNGNDVTKYFYMKNEILLSYYAYLTHSESKYSIQALEDSDILAAPVSEFEKAVEGNYRLLLFYKKMVDGMLVKKENHASSFTLLSSEQRYQQFLAAYPGIEKCVRQHQIASYLGITPVTLSRIRKKLHLIK